ncbi:hypothetical protein ACFQ7B_39455 [Streptomyces erythrochromogenes]|uniref:hypothetical protein n=1 Tax=Streptomyces erythrochromogenes TaxID=285574 RepID=UPI00368F4671
MFAARALAAIVLTAGTVTPVACAPSAHVAPPPSASTSGGNRAIDTHNGSGRGLQCAGTTVGRDMTTTRPSEVVQAVLRWEEARWNGPWWSGS